MNNFDNLIDKHDYLFLQRVGRLIELLNPHDTEHHVYLLPSDHVIHELLIMSECLRDDLRTQLPEPPLQQVPYLIDSLLQHDRLHLAAVVGLWNDCVVRFHLIWLLQGVLCEFLDNHDDLFNGLDDYTLGVILENERGGC
jgi:hypothetical protein